MPHHAKSFNRQHTILAPLILAMLPAVELSGATPRWTGDGQHRILVEVPSGDIGRRDSDEMVAAYEVDFTSALRASKIDGRVDLSTLQVHKFDPSTGRAEEFPPFDSARSAYDRPCRFEDDSLPVDYPGRVGQASDTEDGRPSVFIRKRKARLFNREVNNEAGKIVWVHTQQGARPSYYAIYFDALDSSDEPPGPPPAPWIGDVDVLRKKEDQPLGGFAHFTTATGDLNGDGLFDIVAGHVKGDLMWLPNRGQRGEPRFIGCQILTDEQGPMDVGWYGAPFLFDWDDDGLLDLLVGTSGNVILWWKNVGSTTEPRWRYRGFVQADGGRLEVPESPVAEDTANVFAHDYYNQPWVGDWDGDGRPDILTGGYTTGLIFFYRGVGRDESGAPVLEYVGPIEADGAPIDTTWAAAPYAYDFNGDGKLELVTGSWWWSGIPHKPEPGQVDYLMYYQNQGTAEVPRYTRAALPSEGDFPRGVIARPSVVDWNDDGLVDLFVSDDSGNVYVFLNVGTAHEPKWQLSKTTLTIPWGFVRGYDFTMSWGDVDGDGQPETLVGTTLITVSGSAYSPTMTAVGRATVNGKPIHHPGPGYGDPHSYTTLHDWDRDGKIDLLWGTQQGNIYFHRNLGGDDPFAFDHGVRLTLTNGEPLHVGPEVVDSPEQATDFTILQGSRIVFLAEDFDGDEIDDIVATDTYGKLWVFLNGRAGGTDTLAPGVVVAQMPGRSDSLGVMDWNRDGAMDLIAEGTAAEPGIIFINRSTPGGLMVDDPINPLDLPYLFWGPRFRMTDWNGDGDVDLLIRSEFFSFWAEGSFLKHGYRPASLMRRPGRAGPVQKRKP